MSTDPSPEYSPTSISQLYIHSKSQAKPLRIGVMVDGFYLENAFRQVLIDIEAADFCKVELVIANAQRPLSAPKLRRWARYMDLLRNHRHTLLYKRFQRFNGSRRRNPNPRGPVDCTDLLSRYEKLEVNAVRKRFVDRFPPEAVEAIRAHDLDVILRFGFNILRGDVLNSARYGVWSYHHGDNDLYRGGPACFWEVVEDNPMTGVILQVLTEKLDAGLVLCKSQFPTVRGHWPSRNIFQPYWGSTYFVIRKLNELHEKGWEAVKQQAVPAEPYRGKMEIYRAPTNLQMLKWLAPKAGVFLNSMLNPRPAVKVDHWRICLRRKDSPALLAGSTQDKSNFQWMQSTPGHFYADPFLYEHKGQVWLFYEDYTYGDKLGRIGVAPVAADCSVGTPQLCLDPGYHTSYPFVFAHEGEIYMMPETIMNGTVELWKATDFPYSWKLEKTLFKGQLVDTTPFFHEGRWYFFTALCERFGKAAFGALFYSDHLTGEWTHHPNSPTSVDARTARPAGAVQKSGGRLLRPVQDCGERYGRRMHVEEILELSPEVYRAQRIHSIEPDWEDSLAGVHTYTYDYGIEVLDAVSVRDRRAVAPQRG